MPKILLASEVSSEIRRLDSAWREPETFAFIPDKVGEVQGAVEAVFSTLQHPYDTGHYALLTSGSTGQPKLVFGSRERSESLARVLHEHQQSEPVRETIVLLPLTYCYSFVNQFLWARLFDRRLVLTDGFSRPDELKSALSAAQNAMICLVGAQVPLLMEYYAACVFPGVIRVHFAGGRFPAERLDDVRRLFPKAQIFNNYGCAEALPRLTLRPADAAAEASHVGWPLPGIEISSSAKDELLFRSPYGAVAQADQDGFRVIEASTWVPTGDLGRQSADGHVELMARSSEVFKRHGEKISIPSIPRFCPHRSGEGMSAPIVRSIVQEKMAMCSSLHRTRKRKKFAAFCRHFEPISSGRIGRSDSRALMSSHSCLTERSICKGWENRTT